MSKVEQSVIQTAAIHSARVGLSLALLGAMSCAYALPIDATQSTVIATGKQIGVPVVGKFKKISGDVNFNPAQVAAATAKIEIDVGSYDMGMADYNKNVLASDWFDAAKFPKATFVSTSIKAAAAGSYTVSGQFSLKGKTQAVSFPVTAKAVGANTVFDGVLTIKRNGFGVGSGDWADTSVVADDVAIKFHIVAPTHK
jgi:polyisoprenoid-binding protein YceI